MMRVTALTLGGAALAAGWLALSPAPLAAKERAPREERHVRILAEGGGHLGVALRDVGAEDVARLKLADERGAIVADVVSGSPAEKAGLAEGDVILRFRGEEVVSIAQLARLVRETPPGRKVAIEVSRSGATQRLAATLGERRDLPEEMLREFNVPVPPMLGKDHAFELGPMPWHSDRMPRKLGIEYQEIRGQLARYFRVPDEKGVLVVEVDEEGPAAKAGLKAGDVIVKLNGEAVGDGGDLREALSRVDPGERARVGIQRDGKSMELEVTLGGRRERGGEGSET